MFNFGIMKVSKPRGKWFELGSESFQIDFTKKWVVYFHNGAKYFYSTATG